MSNNNNILLKNNKKIQNYLKEANDNISELNGKIDDLKEFKK